MTEKEKTHLRLIRDDEDAGRAPTSQVLMVLAAEGDKRAFSLLVQRHQVGLRRFCWGILGNRARADEVAQETFLILWKRRKTFNPDKSFTSFLYTVARSKCLNVLRRRKMWRTVDLEKASNQLPIVSAGATEHLEQEGINLLLRRALARLPEKQRTAIILRFVDQLDYEEISLVIKCKPTTARSRVHHGLKKMADFYRRRFDDGTTE